MKELLTTQEACSFLKIGRLTLYRLLKAKKISGCKVGRSWRFKTSILEKWIDDKMEENNKAINKVKNKTSEKSVW